MAIRTIASVGLLAVLSLTLLPIHAAHSAGNGKYCTQTANLVHRACGLEAEDSYVRTAAACINMVDSTQRQACLADAKTARTDAVQLCSDQKGARLDICAAVGEARYDPAFDQQFFDTDFRNLSNPNRFMPLGIGNRWDYSGAGETVKVEILNRTKVIDGVKCIVQRDQVFKGGFIAEDTSDWFAQAKDGNVWYCGEEVKDYDVFANDKPVTPELVSIDGSFKVDRDLARPGIIFMGNPRPGVTYREEVSLANAEDVSEIVSTTYRYGQIPELDKFVPKALVQLLCRGDCVVTHAFTAVAPGVIERKYFAPGIGFILQTRPDTGDTVQLVGCNFDSRCGSLPKP
jgi:hypothetical protein